MKQLIKLTEGELNSMINSAVRESIAYKRKKIMDECRKSDTVTLTESQLKQLIDEAVNAALNELSTPSIVRAKRAALNAYNDERSKGGYGDKRMRQMKAFNDEYNNRTNNSTQLPSDMTQDEFDNARRNNWQ